MNSPDRNGNHDQSDQYNSNETEAAVNARQAKAIIKQSAEPGTKDSPDGLGDYQGSVADTLLGNHSFHRRTSRGGKVDTSGGHGSNVGSWYDTQEYIREHQEE